MKRMLQSAAAIALMASCLALPTVAEAAVNGNGALAQAGPTGLVPLPQEPYEDSNDVHARIKRGEVLSHKVKVKHHLIKDVKTSLGGIHAGTVEIYDSVLEFELTSTDGKTVTVSVPAACETHASYQDPQADRRVLDTTMVRIQGSVGDDHPEFEVFEVVAGDEFGLHSPGTTIITRQFDDIFRVESNFDIQFRLTVRGRAGTEWADIDEVVDGQATMILVGAEEPDASGGDSETAAAR